MTLLPTPHDSVIPGYSGVWEPLVLALSWTLNTLLPKSLSSTPRTRGWLVVREYKLQKLPHGGLHFPTHGVVSWYFPKSQHSTVEVWNKCSQVPYISSLQRTCPAPQWWENHGSTMYTHSSCLDLRGKVLNPLEGL